MATVEFKGKTFTVDEDGFLENLDQWNTEWVDYVKESEGISELNEEHWKVINMLQDYYKKNGIAPMVRILSKVTGFKLKHIYELFPSGPGQRRLQNGGIGETHRLRLKPFLLFRSRGKITEADSPARESASSCSRYG